MLAIWTGRVKTMSNTIRPIANAVLVLTLCTAMPAQTAPQDSSIQVVNGAQAPTDFSKQQQPAPQPSPGASSTNPPAPQMPDAPSSVQPEQQRASDSSSKMQQPANAPAGTAAAKAPVVRGAPASRTVGAAIAPAKQRQRRSLFIKTGLVVGACVAVGSAFALSRGSPSKPPGAP